MAKPKIRNPVARHVRSRWLHQRIVPNKRKAMAPDPDEYFRDGFERTDEREESG